MVRKVGIEIILNLIKILAEWHLWIGALMKLPSMDCVTDPHFAYLMSELQLWLQRAYLNTCYLVLTR